MAELWVNDSGTARQIREVWVNDSGTARRIQEIWVNDSGTARLVFIGDQITISDYTAFSETTQPSAATGSYSLQSDGDIDATSGTNSTGDVGDWIAPKTNMANYEVRATLSSGSTPSTGTLNSWLSLGTSRTWTATQPGIGAGTYQSVLLIEIRRAADGVVMDSATVTIRGQVSA